jgi:hypothetical protein
MDTQICWTRCWCGSWEIRVAIKTPYAGKLHCTYISTVFTETISTTVSVDICSELSEAFILRSSNQFQGANRRSGIQEIPLNLWGSKVDYVVHNIWPMFSVILPSASESLKPFRFSDRSIVAFDVWTTTISVLLCQMHCFPCFLFFKKQVLTRLVNLRVLNVCTHSAFP